MHARRAQEQNRIPHGESQHRPKPRNPFLDAAEYRFRHPSDRKWRVACQQKRLVMRAFVLIGSSATAQQISKLQGICLRQVKYVIARLLKQGFLSNGARTYRRGPDGRRDFKSERQMRVLHPEKLLPRSSKPPVVPDRPDEIESCTPRRESCTGTTPPKNNPEDQGQDQDLPPLTVVVGFRPCTNTQSEPNPTTAEGNINA